MEVITMKKSLTGWAVFQVIEAAVLITVGVITAVFAEEGSFWTALGIIAGVVMILDAVTRMIIEFVKSPVNEIRPSIITWILELAFGIFVCIISSWIIPYLCLIFPIMMIIIGGVILTITILKHVHKGTPPLHLFTGYISAILLVGLGIVPLATYPYQYLNDLNKMQGNGTIKVMLICFGVLLIIVALTEIIFTFIALSKARKREQKVIMHIVSVHEKERESAREEGQAKAKKTHKKAEIERKEVQEAEAMLPEEREKE